MGWPKGQTMTGGVRIVIGILPPALRATPLINAGGKAFI